MSFIYEALKRAEDDNQQRVTAPARSHAGRAVSRGRSRWWMWALIGVLGANALVIGAWTIARSPRAAREASVIAPPQMPAPAPREAPGETAKPVQAISPAKEPRPARATPRASAALSAERGLSGASPIPTRVPVARPVDRPAIPTALVPSSADGPNVTLQVLVYSETPTQRMVFIDGRRYAEGDAIDGETVLERINADGVVVKYRGQRFVIAERRP